MKCPICRENKNEVYNTRLTRFGTQTWRRRRCLNCDASFTTYEQPDLKFLKILGDSSNKTAPYSRATLFSSVYNAFAGSTAKPSVIDAVTDNIEAKLLDLQDHTITTEQITDIVLSTLKHFDSAAFLRYLSDHVDISSPGTMRHYLKKY
jgi:transcriptional repressor NrdR